MPRVKPLRRSSAVRALKAWYAPRSVRRSCVAAVRAVGVVQTCVGEAGQSRGREIVTGRPGRGRRESEV
jgi:hypothetical protein